MLLKPIVGAYVATKSLRQWDEKDETHFFAHLRNHPHIGGLEHGFYGDLHRYDNSWFLKNVDPSWQFAFTTLPGLTERLKVDPFLGLASKETEKRLFTLEFLASTITAIKKLNDFSGKKSVLSVQIHSAPTKHASKEAFAKSLETILSWNWDGAKILIEHCDAKRSDEKHIKGFLNLDEELWVLEQLKSELLGICLNWGRSTIEGRSTQTIQDHIQKTKEKKMLKGFIFSGVAAEDHSPYGYFQDKHVPAPTPYQNKILAKESIMTHEEIRKTIASLPWQTLLYWGIKIMPLPHPENSDEAFVYVDYLVNLLASEGRVYGASS